MIGLIAVLTALIAVTPVLGAPGTTTNLADRVQEMVLDNGLKVVVVERPMAPVFFALMTFRVGSCQELPNHSGLSHFLEHMLFKGTETVGTKDYDKEKPLMERLEQTAAQVKEIQIKLKPWRYDLFEEYATKVKASLPEDVRLKVGGDEAAGWRETLKALPEATDDLPGEWLQTPWTLKDHNADYWAMYRQLLELRIRMAELIAEQRQYIVQAELDGIYDVHGGRMVNAFTAQDQTTYMVGLPANCLELWMFLESDRFRNPVFREFYSEREVVMEELRMRGSEPGGVLMEALQKTAFQAHPYGRPVIGWLGDIRLTLRSDMENHFWSYYAPNNCQITIVGDVKAVEVFKQAKEYFRPWKASKVAEAVTVTEPEQNGERRVDVQFDAEPRLMMGFHAPVAPHPDFYPLAMLDNILSTGRTSRFYRSIFTEQELTVRSPWSGAPSGRYDELFTIGAVPKAPHTADEVEAAILTELEKLKTEPVSSRELERVQNQMRRHRLDRLRSNQWLAFQLSNAFAMRGDWRTIDEDFERLMAVTPEDIQRVAAKYFTAKNRTIVRLVKPEQVAAAGEAETGMEEQ